MTRVAKVSRLNPHNPHVCGACYVIVLGNGEARAGKSKSSAPKANPKTILPIYQAVPDYSFS
jgi:hypothetical protein